VSSNNYTKGLVSICVPTYNRSNLIGELLDSVLVQTYTNFEIIITDNSDNLKTKELIESKYQDERIKYFKNDKNLGMGGNTLKAFSYINGEYLTFTPDDDIWIDKDKLQKQVKFLEEQQDINIVYSNAKSIDYNESELDEFSSIYQDRENNNSIVLSATELLPGVQTKYFLNILTPVLRSEKLIEVFKESWRFESEEYMCYYIAATNEKIGFIYDKTVALREAEHYRTAIEDGKVVDWKKRKDIRIRQMLNIYNTLTTLHPESKEKLETPQVQNFLARHLIGQAKASKSISLLLQTIFSCSLFFRKFSLIDTLRLKTKRGKSFG
jgi:glycosyltransferase involved in cell wall biosynthesis